MRILFLHLGSVSECCRIHTFRTIASPIAKVSSFQFPRLATIPKDVGEVHSEHESPYGLPLYGSSLQSTSLLSPLTSPTAEFTKISSTPISSGVKAEPKFLSSVYIFMDRPGKTEKVSAILQGISTYVSSSLPEALAKMRDLTLPSKTNADPSKLDDSEQDIPIACDPKRVVKCATFGTIEGVYRTPQDLISDTEKTFTHSERKFCLILGYHDGFQIWDLSDLSNITEIFSYRNSNFNVVCIKVLTSLFDEDMETKGSVLRFFSLQTHESIKDISYYGVDMFGLECCERGIIVYYGTTIEIISPHTLDVIFKLNDAHPNFHSNLPILSIGNRLLAYATRADPTNVCREKVIPDTQGFDMTKVAREALSGMKSMSYRKLANYLSHYQHNSGETATEQAKQPSSNQVWYQLKYGSHNPFKSDTAFRLLLSILTNLKMHFWKMYEHQRYVNNAI
ncbi:hypothetical protein K493DRAFT_335147 [Basidiobolus meristosporus CBS 931.73]|uniref:Uncharacterized protein n=1 Tax=Basidiobolus meristosporus CBS 931.73 TaxID=1314790 RepID=A0A1Y1YSG6_9FUNG|nr:hypothetical protein K493DRAFT_335147 [Basidiobolus meristosporus CBS 931.73]|eukprot:ORY00919.1 hypothetical protein K493DRAFT_335147 [Basidiobolus meristosporus CBS 931.73]